MLLGFAPEIRKVKKALRNAAESRPSPDGALRGGSLYRMLPMINGKFYNSKDGSPCCQRAELTVFAISMAIVIGPTPPGTGVIAEAISETGP